jgi:hypothetical protein
MSNAPRIIYRPREDTTAEGELHALSEIYKFVLAKQKAAGRAAPNDAEDLKNDRTVTSSTPEPR